VLLRLAYLGLTNAFALFRLVPMSDKDSEVLALRRQIGTLQRNLGTRPQLARLIGRYWRCCTDYHARPCKRLRLLVRPDAVQRWHRCHSHTEECSADERVAVEPDVAAVIGFYCTHAYLGRT
jgi:putative transposase